MFIEAVLYGEKIYSRRQYALLKLEQHILEDALS